MSVSSWLVALLSSIALCVGTARAEEPEPPFGLKWGVGPEALASWAGRSAQSQAGGGEEVALEVRGPFRGESFQRVFFRFVDRKLCEVTLCYDRETAEASAQLLFELRKQLELAEGNGQLTERGTEANPDGFIESRRVIQWLRSGIAIWLTELQLVDPQATECAARTVSLTYSNLALRRATEFERSKSE